MGDFGVSTILKELKITEVEEVVFFIRDKLGVSNKNDLHHVNENDFAKQETLSEDQKKRLIRCWKPLDFEVSKALSELNESKVEEITFFIKDELGVENKTHLCHITEKDFTSTNMLKPVPARRLINYWKKSK